MCNPYTHLIFLALAFVVFVFYHLPNGIKGLTTKRDHHTATLLVDGNVIVVGGYGYNFAKRSALDSVELLNSASDTWSLTGSLITARGEHTATLLLNGLVLVSGGHGVGGHINSAEVYNVSTGVWTLTGALNTARKDHTATLLSDGKVIVAGGNGKTGSTSSAEVYDVATGIWTITGSLITAREHHTATVLLNGNVLVAGGFGKGFLNSVELYNQSTGVWIETSSLAHARSHHTATMLHNGLVFVTGGHDGEDKSLSTSELYYTSASIWLQAGSLTTARHLHTSTLLSDGNVLVAGGMDGHDSLNSIEVYNVMTNASTLTDSLTKHRYAHTATMIRNGKVFLVGGCDSDIVEMKTFPKLATTTVTKTADVKTLTQTEIQTETTTATKTETETMIKTTATTATETVTKTTATTATDTVTVTITPTATPAPDVHACDGNNLVEVNSNSDNSNWTLFLLLFIFLLLLMAVWLCSQLLRSKSNNDQFQANNDQLQETNDQLQANNDQLQANNSQLQASNDQLQANNDQLQANVDRLQGDLDVVIRSLENFRQERINSIQAKAGFFIKQEHLQVTDTVLGEGHFAKVYQGVLQNVAVAVKQLRRDNGDVGEQALVDFLKEATTMNGIVHTNLTQCFGVCLQFQPLQVSVVYELCELGNLETWLKDQAPSYLQMLHLALDAIRGLRFLEENRIVHGDIAARNVLLKQGGDRVVAKLSDFGLSRPIRDEHGTYFHGNRPLPIAWCSPEMIDNRATTHASDVWAFGVLLWEIFSREEPHRGRDALSIVALIHDRNRDPFQRPNNANDPIWALMKKCWIYEVPDRISILQLLKELEDLVANN